MTRAKVGRRLLRIVVVAAMLTASSALLQVWAPRPRPGQYVIVIVALLAVITIYSYATHRDQ